MRSLEKGLTLVKTWVYEGCSNWVYENRNRITAQNYNYHLSYDFSSPVRTVDVEILMFGLENNLGDEVEEFVTGFNRAIISSMACLPRVLCE